MALRIRRNKRAKRLILRADPVTGTAVVTCPPWVSDTEARAFAEKQAGWVRARLETAPRPVPFADGAVIPYLGLPHVIRHRPDARGGVWIEADGTGGGEIHVTGLPEHLPRRLGDWLKRDARRRIHPSVAAATLRLGVTPGRITLRDTKSRWGSCAANGNLSFSWRLVLAPERVLHYVVAHEVAHLKEHNHGPRFWALVRDLADDMDDCRRWLRDEGSALHLFGPVSD
ncbi:MAG: M48 family peptidase [Rhodospirillales bacterium CG15_BIG_FIL_POST_REV_8_21_14_020_66_15]|nr:MAG: M48 family peptidase [Rhodospirillales bacterium CG15_BIG_FIL_POST_REV_8_21_14_020_66_15]